MGRMRLLFCLIYIYGADVNNGFFYIIGSKNKCVPLCQVGLIKEECKCTGQNKTCTSYFYCGFGDPGKDA